MKLSSSIALAAVIVAGAAAPAFASPSSSGDIAFERDFIVSQLQHKGVNAVDADENTNGIVRVTVELADGTEQFVYYKTDGLTPVSGTGSAVLTKLDTGSKPLTHYYE